jgi:exonuclease SbcD
VLRWETITADVSGAADQEECLSRLEQAVQTAADLHDGYPLAMRLVLQGVTPAHESLQAKHEQFENELRGQVADWTSGLGWVEKIRLHTRSPHVAAHGNTPLGLIRRIVEELAQGGAQPLFAELDELKRKLPLELRDAGPDSLPWDDAQWFRELLNQAEAELLDRVQHERGAP